MEILIEIEMNFKVFNFPGISVITLIFNSQCVELLLKCPLHSTSPPAHPCSHFPSLLQNVAFRTSQAPHLFVDKSAFFALQSWKNNGIYSKIRHFKYIQQNPLRIIFIDRMKCHPKSNRFVLSHLNHVILVYHHHSNEIGQQRKVIQTHTGKYFDL